MFSPTFLDISIGLALTYLLVSLLCSAAAEILEAISKFRAADLHRGILELLSNDTSMVAAVYKHPLINGLFQGVYEDSVKRGGTAARWSSDLPSYVPSANFALALTDVILSGTAAGAQKPPLSAGSLRQALAQSPAVSQQLRQALGALLDGANNDLDKFRASVGAWFDSSMDRVAGWYKRRSATILLVLGAVFAVLFNVDTVEITKRLSVDTTLRNGLVAAAQETVKRGAPQQHAADLNTSIKGFSDALTDLEKASLPIGWPRSSPIRNGWDVVWQVIGWLLTALAVSLGAPFWFDVLNKFVVVRSTVKPTEKSPAEPSKD